VRQATSNGSDAGAIASEKQQAVQPGLLHVADMSSTRLVAVTGHQASYIIEESAAIMVPATMCQGVCQAQQRLYQLLLEVMVYLSDQQGCRAAIVAVATVMQSILAHGQLLS